MSNRPPECPNTCHACGERVYASTTRAHVSNAHYEVHVDGKTLTGYTRHLECPVTWSTRVLGAEQTLVEALRVFDVEKHHAVTAANRLAGALEFWMHECTR